MRCFMMRLLPAAMFVGDSPVRVAAVTQAQAQGVAGYSPSYRVSDYLGAPGNLRHELRVRQLRNAADLLRLLGLSRPVLRLELSSLWDLARPVRGGPVATGLRRAWVCLRGIVLLPAV